MLIGKNGQLYIPIWDDKKKKRLKPYRLIENFKVCLEKLCVQIKQPWKVSLEL